MKRRLREEGCSFRQLRDEIVGQLSQEALKQTDAQVSEIALKLGYSELSSFDRAFGRLTGMSPTRVPTIRAHILIARSFDGPSGWNGWNGQHR